MINLIQWIILYLSLFNNVSWSNIPGLWENWLTKIPSGNIGAMQLYFALLWESRSFKEALTSDELLVLLQDIDKHSFCFENISDCSTNLMSALFPFHLILWMHFFLDSWFLVCTFPTEWKRSFLIWLRKNRKKGKKSEGWPSFAGT